MMKLMNGQITADIAEFTEMGNQEFKNQFDAAVKMEIHLTMPNGEIRVVSIGEILSHDIKAYDTVDCYEIVEESLLTV
jgi:hypothetical protein